MEASELRRVRSAAALCESPSPVLLRARGADRVSFLHRLLSCDVQGVPVGGGTRGLLLTPKGKVTAEFALFVLGDRVEMVASAEARPGLLAGLSKFVIADDVAMEDRGGAAALLSLVGPRAEEAAARVWGGPLPFTRRPGAADLSVGDAETTVLIHSLAGLPAVEFLCAAADREALRAVCLAGAASVGGGELSVEGLEILRVENGVPRLGAEMGEETLPQEAGVVDRVSFSKGCFLGQEPVARLQNRGHTNRGLAGVVLEAGAPVPVAGDALLDGGKEVGAITSAVLSPSLGRPVALCHLRNESAVAGARLDVRHGDGVLSCVVSPLPFPQGG